MSYHYEPYSREYMASGTQHKNRKVMPKGIIFHTMGRSFINKIRNELVQAGYIEEQLDNFTIDEHAAKRLNERPYLAGWMIGQTGLVFKLEEDQKKTLHAGSLKKSVYKKDNWRDWGRPLGGLGWMKHGRDPHRVYDWFDAWFGREFNPSKDFDWGRFPNQCIGIDLVPDQQGKYTLNQMSGAVDLVEYLVTEHNIPMDEYHIVTHGMAAPCERGTVMRRGKCIGVDWDPGRHWDHGRFLYEQLEIDNK